MLKRIFRDRHGLPAARMMFTLLFDRPFLVGDQVTFGDTYGDIKSIGPRAVRVVTLDDNPVTIPNNRFMNDVVASGNAGALDMMVVMNFHLSLDADIVKARDILYEVLVTSRFVYLNKPVNTVVAEVAAAEQIVIQLAAKAYVLDTRFEKDFQTDVFLRATEAFRNAGIGRPLLMNKDQRRSLVLPASVAKPIVRLCYPRSTFIMVIPLR